MAGGLPMLPPGAVPGAGPPPGPPGPPPGMAPSPMAALAGARPPGPPGGGGGAGGMSQMMLTFLAGLGFKDFAKTMQTLRGDKGGKGDKQSQAGGLIKNLGAARALPQNAMTPGGGPSIPPMLAGAQGPGFLALLAKLAAATQGRGMQ